MTISSKAVDLLNECAARWGNVPPGSTAVPFLSRADAKIALTIATDAHLDQVATKAALLCPDPANYPGLALYVRPRKPFAPSEPSGYYIAVEARTQELRFERTRLRALHTQLLRRIASYSAMRNGPASQQTATYLRAALVEVEQAMIWADRAV